MDRHEGVETPVARLSVIVASKANAGREKDRLFLATHAEALREMARADEPDEQPQERSQRYDNGRDSVSP